MRKFFVETKKASKARTLYLNYEQYELTDEEIQIVEEAAGG